MCPTGKSSSMQHWFFAFHSSFARQQRPIFWRSRHKKAGFRKHIIQIISWVTRTDPLCRSGPHHTHPARPKTVRRTQAPQCWDSDHRAPLEVIVPHMCSNKNKLLAPPLISVRQHYAECTILGYAIAIRQSVTCGWISYKKAVLAQR